MSNIESARRDLAYMRAIAQDKDPLPWFDGANLIAPGIIYAPLPLAAWAALSGYISLPDVVLEWMFVPALVIHAIAIAVLWRYDRTSAGPNRRMFGAAWGAMGAMSATVLASLFVAANRIDAPVLLLWAPIAFVLYGGTWTVIAATHRRLWHALIAIGCFATAILCASQIGQPVQWLTMGIGIFVWIGGPGFLILAQAAKARG